MIILQTGEKLKTKTTQTQNKIKVPLFLLLYKLILEVSARATKRVKENRKEVAESNYMECLHYEYKHTHVLFIYLFVHVYIYIYTNEFSVLPKSIKEPYQKEQMS